MGRDAEVGSPRTSRAGSIVYDLSYFEGRSVKQPNGCWEWSGATMDGYGYIKGGTKVHRAVYELTTGRRPEVLHHTCENRLCCNPNHLVETVQGNHWLSHIYKDESLLSLPEGWCHKGHPLVRMRGRRKRCLTCWNDYQRDYQRERRHRNARKKKAALDTRLRADSRPQDRGP